MFDIRTSEKSGASIVSLVGEVDLAVRDRIEAALLEAESRSENLIVLDLGEVGFMDSTGLHLLLEAAARAGESGRRFVLAAVPGAVRRVLEVAGVLEHFAVVADPAEALEARS
jgi:anti-anti-sigma factor